MTKLKIHTHPKVVEMTHDSLELQRYVHIDVLVEAWLDGAEGRQRRPVVPSSGRTGAKFCFSPS